VNDPEHHEALLAASICVDGESDNIRQTDDALLERALDAPASADVPVRQQFDRAIDLIGDPPSRTRIVGPDSL
jgi:hypothetical protein